jgi:hypothetical protein
VRNRSVILLIAGGLLLSGIVVALLIRFPVRDPTEGGVTVLITNDRQESLYVVPCEDQRCRQLVGGRLLVPGASIAPTVQPFTDVPFAVKAEGTSNMTCLLLVLNKDINKSYGLSALVPCTL